jgi:hypothetical protein
MIVTSAVFGDWEVMYDRALAFFIDVADELREIANKGRIDITLTRR